MKRRRLWLWVLVPPLVLAAIGGGIVWDAHRRADAVIERGRREALALVAEYRSKDASRPVLAGEPTEGNAWEIYTQVLLVLGKLPADEADEVEEVAGDWMEDRRADDEVLDFLHHKYAPELARLREALQRRVMDPNYDLEDAEHISFDHISPALATAKFLTGMAAHLHRVGRGRESLDLATLGIGVSHDLRRRAPAFPLLVALVGEAMVCIGVMEALAEHRYGVEDLRAFAARLDRLDTLRPSPLGAWDVEEIYIRSVLSQARFSLQADLVGARPGLRELYSWRILQAGALSRVPGEFARGRDLIALPSPERAREVGRLAPKGWRVGEDADILGSLMAPLLKSLLKNDVEVLALRTLLRTSVAAALYEMEQGAFPTSLDALVPRYLARVPACPYSGKPLRCGQGKVWSTGADAIDDGGAPDPAGDPFNFQEPGSDVVVTVKRWK